MCLPSPSSVWGALNCFISILCRCLCVSPKHKSPSRLLVCSVSSPPSQPVPLCAPLGAQDRDLSSREWLGNLGELTPVLSGTSARLGETFSEGSFESLPAGFAALGNVTEPQTPLVSLLCLIGEWESRDCGIPDWVRLGRARLVSPPCSSRAIPGHRAQECLECPREGRSNTLRPLLK